MKGQVVCKLLPGNGCNHETQNWFLGRDYSRTDVSG